MKSPSCRIHSVGEITSWAKQFLDGLAKAGLAELSFEPKVDRFCEVSSPHVALVFVENAPDMKQAILKLRASGRSLLVVWYGKIFSKEDVVFALENRLYSLLENPKWDDKKVEESLRRYARAVETVQQYDQHLHSLKALLLQGEAEEGALESLLQDFKAALSKLERAGLHTEFLGHLHGAKEGDESLPFYHSQDLGDAMITVHDLERTGALWVRGSVGGQEGKIEFLQGKVISATAGTVRGVKAIYRMFLWDDPRFLFHRVDPDDYVMEDHLNVSLKQMSLEGDDLRQRYQRIRRDLPPPELKLELEPNALHPGSQLQPVDFSALASIVEFGQVSQVLDYNSLPDVDLYESLIRLRKTHKLIRVANS